jgi:hypothetical protein
VPVCSATPRRGRDNLSDLEFNLVMLVAPALRKPAYADTKAGTLSG